MLLYHATTRKKGATMPDRLASRIIDAVLEIFDQAGYLKDFGGTVAEAVGLQNVTDKAIEQVEQLLREDEEKE